MIREFQVENYLSIKDKQTINFEASPTDDDWATVDCGDGTRLNKLGIIFGANASGKSNMLYAIQDCFKLLVNSRQKKSEPVKVRAPFALTQEQPSKMSLSFYANNTRYDYDICFNSNSIISEHLDWYPGKKKSLFYKREYVDNDSQIKLVFSDELGISERTKNVFLQNTLNNHTLLSTFEKTSFETDAKQIAELYSWLETHVSKANATPNTIIDTLSMVENNSKAKQFFIQMLRKADFNITDFNTNRSVSNVFFNNSAGNNSFTTDLYSQSQGTLRYLSNLILLYRAVTGNHIFLVDEIDTDLHNELLQFYLSTFVMNSNGSQLIFTSQATSLMQEDFISDHPSFVFFAEKNASSASSSYARADQFKLSKSSPFYNLYRSGRIGAVPLVGSPLLHI